MSQDEFADVINVATNPTNIELFIKQEEIAQQ